MPRKNVLVTRPVGQLEAFSTALSEAGYYPFELPLLKINPVTGQGSSSNNSSNNDIESIKSRILKLDEYQHCIFISTNAVTYGWYWIDQFWPQLPVRQQWYAIGKATSAALHDNVDTVQTAGQVMNSEALLDLPGLQDLQQQKVLIFRGKGGREYLKTRLEQRGALVDYCEVYQRQPLVYTGGELAAMASKLDILTATSGETIQLLHDQAIIDDIKNAILQLPLVVPGKRLVAIAKKTGFNQVIEADNASIDAMLDALRR